MFALKLFYNFKNSEEEKRLKKQKDEHDNYYNQMRLEESSHRDVEKTGVNSKHELRDTINKKGF